MIMIFSINIYFFCKLFIPNIKNNSKKNPMKNILRWKVIDQLMNFIFIIYICKVSKIFHKKTYIFVFCFSFLFIKKK